MNGARKLIIRKAATAAGCAVVAFAALASAIWTWDTCTVTYTYPDSQGKMVIATARTVRGFAPLNAPSPDYEDLTLLGWKDEEGNILGENSIKPHEDMILTAVLMPALETEDHMAYLAPLEHGLFCPDEPMTRGDAAQMIRGLLTGLNTNTGNVLPGLGLVGMAPGEDQAHDPITRRELIPMLAQFYPKTGETYAFSDVTADDPDYAAFCTAAARGWIDAGGEVVPDREMTRGEVAVLMNRVLGRKTDPNVTAEMIGVLSDVEPDHPLYADIVEACVSHTYEMSHTTETWQTSDPIEAVEPGLFMIGTKLCCIGEDGYLVKNGTWGSFSFDENGVFTSGMPELDVLVQEVLAEITDESMTSMEKLRAAYDYTRDSFTYLRRNYYETGATGWGEEEAYTMLSTGYGNCYCYAAAFYELARALGYDAILISGTIGTDRDPHGWVEFELDGQMYVCDPEIEMTYHRDRPDSIPDMFMMDYSKASGWSYARK